MRLVGYLKENTGVHFVGYLQNRPLRVASGATAPGPALEGAPRFRPKFARQVAKVDLV